MMGLLPARAQLKNKKSVRLVPMPIRGEARPFLCLPGMRQLETMAPDRVRSLGIISANSESRVTPRKTKEKEDTGDREEKPGGEEARWDCTLPESPSWTSAAQVLSLQRETKDGN